MSHPQPLHICPLKRKTHESASINFPELPDHIIPLILKNILQVKTIVRFYSVSKQWELFLKNSTFADQHFKLVTQSKVAPCSVFFSSTEYVHCQISISSKKTAVELPLLLPYDFEYYTYCSCNGLLCVIQITRQIQYSMVCVCNPATRKYKKVLTWPVEGSVCNSSVVVMGFGYDASIDDYKIIVFYALEYYSYHTTKRAMVISLKENTWRMLDLTTSPCIRYMNGYDVKDRRSSVVVNGNMYWITFHKKHRHHGVLKFNLAQEIFDFLPLPQAIGDETAQIQHKLAAFDGVLYVFVWDYDIRSRRQQTHTFVIDIWILKDHITWRKVSTIPAGEYNLWYKLFPLGFNLSGHVIMVDWLGRRIVVYNPQTGKFVKLAGQNFHAACSSAHLVQVETLVNP